MAEIGGQHADVLVEVHPGAIPPEQGVDGESCVAYAEFRITGIRWTAGLCALPGCFGWWGPLSVGVFVRIIPARRRHRPSESSQPIREGAGWLAALLGAARIGEESPVCSFHYRMQR